MSLSNYYDSTLLGYQGRISEGYNKAELRELETMALQIGLDNQKYLMGVDKISEIKESTYRPVYGYQYVRKPNGTGTAMTPFNTGTQGASAQVALTWVAFTEEFYTYETTGFDNVMKHQEIWDNEMQQAQRSLRERLRTWLIQNLYANRTTVVGSTNSNLATWNAGNAAFEISDSTKLWANMSSIMRLNKYGYSDYDVFADSTMYSNFEYSAAQGTMNATNLAYQFAKEAVKPNAGGRMSNIMEDIILSNTVASGYTTGAALVLPKNSFAFIPWMPKIYIQGYGDFETYSGGKGIVQDDTINGLEYMVQGWKTQVDASGSHGFTADTITQWQIGIYVCFQQAVLSTAGETAIYEFAYKP